MRYALFALVLSGCVNALPVGAERPPNSDDMRVIDATRDAWIAAGQPWGSQCESEYAEIVVVRAPTTVPRYRSGRTPGAPRASHRTAPRTSPARTKLERELERLGTSVPPASLFARAFCAHLRKHLHCSLPGHKKTSGTPFLPGVDSFAGPSRRKRNS